MLHPGTFYGIIHPGNAKYPLNLKNITFRVETRLLAGQVLEEMNKTTHEGQGSYVLSQEPFPGLIYNEIVNAELFDGSIHFMYKDKFMSCAKDENCVDKLADFIYGCLYP